MNNISLMGRLTADPELKYTANNYAVLSFTVAVPRPNTKDTTDFIRCVAWRKTAEFVSKYFFKGKMIALTGALTSRSWKDDNNKSHYVMEVTVNNVEFCGDKAKNNNEHEHLHYQETQATLDDIPEGFETVPEDEVPF